MSLSKTNSINSDCSDNCDLQSITFDDVYPNNQYKNKQADNQELLHSNDHISLFDRLWFFFFFKTKHNNNNSNETYNSNENTNCLFCNLCSYINS